MIPVGLSAEQMAVLLGAGTDQADVSHDGETVAQSGLITSETRIRTPQQSGLVSCQIGKGGAKAGFDDVFIELMRGTLTFKDCIGGRDGTILRTANVIGCVVGVPKAARKGHENAFRIDLASGVKDSLGESKYVISVDTAEEVRVSSVYF